MTIYAVTEKSKLIDEYSAIPVIKNAKYFTSRAKAEEECAKYAFRERMYELEQAQHPEWPQNMNIKISAAYYVTEINVD